MQNRIFHPECWLCYLLILNALLYQPNRTRMHNAAFENFEAFGEPARLQPKLQWTDKKLTLTLGQVSSGLAAPVSVDSKNGKCANSSAQQNMQQCPYLRRCYGTDAKRLDFCTFEWYRPKNAENTERINQRPRLQLSSIFAYRPNLVLS